jgi:hypothetical protein
MFGINHQIGQGCAGNSCSTGGQAISGVYNSHSSPHQGVQMGSLPFNFNVLQPGLNQPLPMVARPPLVGSAPIGNFLIGQTVPSNNTTFPFSPPLPSPSQKVIVPTLVQRGRPTIGANESITDNGIVWNVCQNVNMGLFNQQVCRQYPKFG